VEAGAALDRAERFLGPGYREIAPGIFRSKGDLRQVRMTDSDMTGAHGQVGPHLNFEKYVEGNPYVPVTNEHLPIFE